MNLLSLNDQKRHFNCLYANEMPITISDCQFLLIGNLIRLYIKTYYFEIAHKYESILYIFIIGTVFFLETAECERERSIFK